LRAALTALLFLAVSGLAVADESRIREVVEAKLGGAKVEGIRPAPVAGLYEVRFRSREGIRIIYTDAQAAHIISGKIFETGTDRDLTEERMRKLNAIRFDSLPLDQAVKIRRGNGKRVMAMFSDPYCPACKSYEQALQQVDDVTIYVFMFPVIREELAGHSKAVWCSADRAKAWLDLALNGRRPAATAGCENPIEQNVELGRRLGIMSTPTTIFANGEKVAGGLPAADLRDLLDQAVAQSPQHRR
jgi:thiol:disulfide interchange protein DsbC